MKSMNAVLAAALLVPAAAFAQGTMTPAAVPVQEPAGSYRMIAGAVETKTTTDRPYSADAITETTQVLADGNRIHRASRTKMYRDGQGRTRREMYDNEGKLVSIAISDPVAKVSYTLNPDEKIAFKTPPLVIGRAVMPEGQRPAAGAGVGGFVTRPPSAAPAVRTPGQPAGGAGGERRAVVARTPAPEDPNVKKEELGSQNIEGVVATGARTTTTIPAGQIGNAQDIRVISEQWFSDELQMLVLTKHSDPRSGDTVYSLKNILRAEPDPSLFTVPADYTIQERPVRQ